MTIALWLLVVSCGMADVDRGEMFIRVGDLDGVGFMTGTAPGNGEAGWPFNSPKKTPCPTKQTTPVHRDPRRCGIRDSTELKNSSE